MSCRVHAKDAGCVSTDVQREPSSLLCEAVDWLRQGEVAAALVGGEVKETEEKEEWVSKHIEVLAGECRGCEICAIECSLGHVGVPVVRRARINVFQALGVSRPEVCQLCDLQACAKACPQKAIRRDAQRGIQVVDEEKCVGCGACVAACPYRGIRLDPATTKPMFCDLCGGAPKCVAACPFGALVYTETRNKREG